MNDFYDKLYEKRQGEIKKDPEMKGKWKNLTALGKAANDQIRDNFLDAKERRTALNQERERVNREIFNVIANAYSKPNFSWERKGYYNEERETFEYVIRCLNPYGDKRFTDIKELRKVASMHGESIDEYLIPVTERIRELKQALEKTFDNTHPTSNPNYTNVRGGIGDFEAKQDEKK